MINLLQILKLCNNYIYPIHKLGYLPPDALPLLKQSELGGSRPAENIVYLLA